MRWRRDDGISAVEVVVTMPALLLAVLLVIQFALWQHAQHVALTAAQEGARAARAYDGSTEAARARTHAFLDTLGPRMITHRSVTITRTAADATVTVEGRMVSIVGFVPLRISEKSTGPIERFVPAATGAAAP